MKKRFLTLVGFGFLLGTVIGVVIAAICTLLSTGSVQLYSNLLLERVGSPVVALLLQILLSGFLGAICMGGVIVYDIDRWPLALASVVHYLTIVLSYTPIAILLGWEDGVIELLIVIGIMTVIFFLIWLIMHAIYKAQIRALNRMNAAQKPDDSEKS